MGRETQEDRNGHRINSHWGDSIVEAKMGEIQESVVRGEKPVHQKNSKNQVSEKTAKI